MATFVVCMVVVCGALGVWVQRRWLQMLLCLDRFTGHGQL
jgi:hypothetical protein